MKLRSPKAGGADQPVNAPTSGKSLSHRPVTEEQTLLTVTISVLKMTSYEQIVTVCFSSAPYYGAVLNLIDLFLFYQNSLIKNIFKLDLTKTVNNMLHITNNIRYQQ